MCLVRLVISDLISPLGALCTDWPSISGVSIFHKPLVVLCRGNGGILCVGRVRLVRSRDYQGIVDLVLPQLHLSCPHGIERLGLVVFAPSRPKLGSALQSSHAVSVVGIDRFSIGCSLDGGGHVVLDFDVLFFVVPDIGHFLVGNVTQRKNLAIGGGLSESDRLF